MHCKTLSCSLALIALLSTTAHAQDVPVAELTSHHASIRGEDGLVRLPLPPEVLAIAAPDLSDVRVRRSSGGDLPYVIDREEHLTEAVVSDVRTPLEPTSAVQSRGRGRAPGAVTYREVYTVGIPSPPIDSTHSTETVLVFTTEVADFTATVWITGFGEHVEATVVRIPAMGVELLEVALPPRMTGPIEIALENETGFLSPGLFVQRRVTERRPARLTRPLELVSTRMEGTTQVVVLTRPAGVVPLSLRLDLASTSFAAHTTALVRSADEGARELGSATLYRVPPRAPGLPGTEQLDIPVRDWLAGETIELRIERGDSPPLDGVSVTAELREVALVFENERDTALHFGGARLRLPVYDLGILAVSLRDPLLERASLDPIEETEGYTHEPLLSFAMRAGTAIERARYRSVAAVTLPDAPEGLTRVELSPALLAAARADLSDVRVVSPDGLQWPYVVSPDTRDVEVSATVATEAEPDRVGESRHEIALPHAPLAPTRLSFDPSELFFARSVEIWGQAEGDTAPHLLTSDYVHRDGGVREPIELIPYAGGRLTRLYLVVDDGDEAPLTFAAVTLTVSVSDLLVTAPAGDYEVVAGDELARAPSYDLARVDADVLRNVAIATTAIGEVTANPSFHTPTFIERSGWQSVALWATLIVAVVVLLGLTLRLARSEPEASGGSGAGSGSEEETGRREGEGEGEFPLRKAGRQEGEGEERSGGGSGDGGGSGSGDGGGSGSGDGGGSSDSTSTSDSTSDSDSDSTSSTSSNSDDDDGSRGTS